MKIEVEEVPYSKKALLLFKKRSVLVGSIKKILQHFRFETYLTTKLPKKNAQFDYLFIFDDIAAVKHIMSTSVTSTKILAILVGQRKEMQRFAAIARDNKRKDIKFVNIGSQVIDRAVLEKILWFLFSKSRENALDFEREIKKEPNKKKVAFNQLYLHIHLTKKRIFFFLLALLFAAEVFFVAPLTASFFFLYKSSASLVASDISKTQYYLNRAAPFRSATNNAYQFSRPVLSFFFLALVTDNIVGLQNDTFMFIKTTTETTNNVGVLASLIMQKYKTQHEQQQVATRLKLLKKQIRDLSNSSTHISQKLTFDTEKVLRIKSGLKKTQELLDQTEKILSHADTLIGGSRDKRYLVLFHNNMELRPGGGFIGSFGIFTFSDYTLKDIQIEDVYTADGQLKGHIEPPPAIKNYLDQPHWFLRDSNFSPDFKTNFDQAEFFLDKELGPQNFDGGVGISTTAISYILEVFDDIYLPDYQENINSKNFYIKTQTHSEQDFFPGSIQKKSFLSSLVTALFVRLDGVSYKDLGPALIRALDEKHIVVFIKDESAQSDIEAFGFGGKIVVPKCATDAHHCIADTVFPVDANLGVNKANFFLSRLINQKVTITDDGELKSTLSVTFKNDSDEGVFPGGQYKNYFQVYLPKASAIEKVLHDNEEVKKYEEKVNDNFRILSYFLTVEPKQNSRVTVKYKLKNKLTKGRNTYQLIVQKQIGAFNNDLAFELYLPDNVSVVDKNFTALAKDGSLVYNTSLSGDRIFLIELEKE